MLLILTASDDSTADYLVARLLRSDVTSIRFDTDADLTLVFPEYRSETALLNIDGQAVLSSDISNIWFRRPTPLQPSGSGEAGEREHIAAEWSAALESFLSHVPIERWMNHPAQNALASHKTEQLSRAVKFGLKVPESIVTRRPEVLRSFWKACSKRLVAKPLSFGYIERERPEADTLIYTSRVTQTMVDEADATLPVCPTLFQREIDKKIDVRICFVDGEVHPVGLTATDAEGHQRLDIRRNGMSGVSYSPISIDEPAKSAIVALAKSYNLRFAAIDMAVDRDGSWVFFELNPNGQWAWLDLVGGCDIASSFIRSFRKPFMPTC